jgi:hypothetical protein
LAMQEYARIRNVRQLCILLRNVNVHTASRMAAPLPWHAGINPFRDSPPANAKTC